MTLPIRSSSSLDEHNIFMMRLPAYFYGLLTPRITGAPNQHRLQEARLISLTQSVARPVHAIVSRQIYLETLSVYLHNIHTNTLTTTADMNYMEPHNHLLSQKALPNSARNIHLFHCHIFMHIQQHVISIYNIFIPTTKISVSHYHSISIQKQ